MGRDVLELVEAFVSDDPSRWAKLASTVQWRRLQLLLLREVLLELRRLSQALQAGVGSGISNQVAARATPASEPGDRPT
jgi:hypothetical protein